MQPNNLVSFDLETHLIRPGVLAPKMVCLSVDDGDVCDVVGYEDGLRVMQNMLSSKRLHLVGCNIPYDLGVLCAEDDERFLPLVFDAIEDERLWDVSLLEALHDNGRGVLFTSPTGQKFARYSLALLTMRHEGLDISASKKGPDIWRLRYGELDGKPVHTWPVEAQEYPKDDVRHARAVALKQFAEGRLNTECHGHEFRMAWAMHLMSMWGMRTDPKVVDVAVAEVERLHGESRREFMEAGLVKLRKTKRTKGVLEDADVTDENGQGWVYQTDVKMLSARVEAAYDGKPPLTSGGKKGIKKTSTDRLTLLQSGDEQLIEFAEAGVNEKLYSTYCDILRQGVHTPINPEVNVLLSSGRASVRKPALQTLPRSGPIREAFIPRDGNLYCSVDYGGGELATWAQVCLDWVGYSRMADALKQGLDLHTKLGARLASMSYDKLKSLVAAGDEQGANFRQMAKPVNFGLPGGMGPPALVRSAHKQDVQFCILSGKREVCGETKTREYVYKFGKQTKSNVIPPTCTVCLELGVEYRNMWREEYPESREYHAKVRELVDSGRPAISFGNGMIRGDVDFTSCSNHFFQNLLAYAAKRAAWRLTKECYLDKKSPLYGCRPVLFLHDELLTEMPEDVAPEASDRKALIMREAFSEVCPDVPITAEPALMRRWYKGAKTVRDATGRLLVWEPKISKAA